MKKQLPPDTIVTPEFITCYPSLITPYSFRGGPLKYQVTALFRNNNLLEPMRNLAQNVAKRYGHDIRRIKSPFLDGNLSTREAFANGTYMRFWAMNPVQALDESGQVIITDSQVYNGCIGKAVVKCGFYPGPGQPGVSFYLLSYKKIRDGEPLQLTTDFSDFLGVENEKSGSANIYNDDMKIPF